jgi:hypothetical protein
LAGNYFYLSTFSAQAVSKKIMPQMGHYGEQDI